jgi:hypothetical protein
MCIETFGFLNLFGWVACHFVGLGTPRLSYGGAAWTGANPFALVGTSSLSSSPSCVNYPWSGISWICHISKQYVLGPPWSPDFDMVPSGGWPNGGYTAINGIGGCTATSVLFLSSYAVYSIHINLGSYGWHSWYRVNKTYKAFPGVAPSSPAQFDEGLELRVWTHHYLRVSIVHFFRRCAWLRKYPTPLVSNHSVLQDAAIQSCFPLGKSCLLGVVFGTEYLYHRHRPYLALFQQTLAKHVVNIANGYHAADERYQTAALFDLRNLILCRVNKPANSIPDQEDDYSWTTEACWGAV